MHQNRFGEALGEKVWESCNAVFDRLPLAGVIDQDIFCVHGGIPRPLEGSASRIQVGWKLLWPLHVDWRPYPTMFGKLL